MMTKKPNKTSFLSGGRNTFL